MDKQSPELPPLAAPGELGPDMVSPQNAQYGPPLEKQASKAMEYGSYGAPSTQGPLPQAMPVQQPGLTAQGQVITDPGVHSTQGNPAIADDTDLIEKEWVIKAKHIVEQTKGDPHVRNSEMNKVKVDYLKKRYNKDVKLAE